MIDHSQTKLKITGCCDERLEAAAIAYAIWLYRYEAQLHHETQIAPRRVQSKLDFIEGAKWKADPPSKENPMPEIKPGMGVTSREEHPITIAYVTRVKGNTVWCIHRLDCPELEGDLEDIGKVYDGGKLIWEKK